MPASAPTAPNGRSPGNVLTRCRDPDKPVAAAFSCQQTQRGGGEAQKVAIGRAMAQETSVLLLDKPTSNLDLRNQLEVLDIIREMAADRGVAAIVTMHDLNLALRFADKFILMRGGTIWDMGRQGDHNRGKHQIGLFGGRHDGGSQREARDSARLIPDGRRVPS